MRGESAAKISRLLGRLRSHKGEYELADTGISIARAVSSNAIKTLERLSD
jgi:hypothetical protein